LIAALEDQRFELEEQLIEVRGTDGTGAQSNGIRENLKRNEELRLGYLTEWKSLSGATEEPRPAVAARTTRTVFVSSTSKDLHEHRAVIKDQIARRDLLFRGMEHFGADPNNQSPAARIVDEVRKSDLYVGVFGVRYGSIDPATGVSMTELEFNEAEATNKPMLLYVICETAPVRVADIEPTASGKAKLDALRAKILNSYTPYLFTTVEDLAKQVFEDPGKPITAFQTASGS